MKHTWQLDKDGDIDDFAYEVEEDGRCCNGPKCIICGFCFCHHCNPYGYNDNACPGEIDDNK
jgi:hypothetical protein